MKAYLIDPYKKEITEVEYDGNYKSIYTFIDAKTFDIARLPEGDGIYVDDEGLLSMSGETMLFYLVGQSCPLAGKGLVLGCDETGESAQPKISIDELRTVTVFMDTHTVATAIKMGLFA